MEHEPEVSLDREVRPKSELLEHHPHATLRRLDVNGMVAHDRALNRNMSVVRVFKPGDQSQQRRLAASRRSEQRHALAFRDGKVQPGQRDD
jgi:hypothetical protein